ncbi:MAG: tyrosine--tRNA ligase [Actinomycetota bacterium]
MELLDDLLARDLIQDSTDLDAFRARLAEGPITLYYGCDPSADSLHVGNLIGLVVLRRFQLAGHRPIALAGGATGMIGDPGGKSAERNLLADAELTANVDRIREQMGRFVDFDDPVAPAMLVDNRDWTAQISILEFLRDPGKFITVQQMMGKESVRSRLGGDQGLSYTEFSYMLLQANDFAHLAEIHDCELQIGGADQWGNISLGVDLTRRRLARHVHAFTWPLVTRSDGSKYGKTAGGETMWLGAHRMSPYAFYQGWMHLDDANVRRLLAQLTFLSLDEVDEVASAHEAVPEQREGQRRLAHEVTGLVHGTDAAVAAAEASAVLFGGDADAASEAALAMVAEEAGSTAVDRADLGGDGLSVVDVLVSTGLAGSKGEARRLLDQGGVSVNGTKFSSEDRITGGDFRYDSFALLRRGKKRWHVLRIGAPESPEKSAEEVDDTPASR